MDLKAYFENHTGFGVLSTADQDGRVNAAVYSRPHFMEDGSLAFIMRGRLTHQNLQKNPNAVYLFREKNQGYKGYRLYLTKVGEDTNQELIESISRRSYVQDRSALRYLVYFRLDEVLPLVGSGDVASDVD